MNSKIIYGVVFLIAFLLTTAAIIFMNNKYNNVFKMDFAPAGSSDSLKIKADSLKLLVDSLKGDTLKVHPDQENKNPGAISEQKPENGQPAKPETKTENKAESKPAANNKITLPSIKENTPVKPPVKDDRKTVSAAKAKADSEYVAWIKNTATLYDLMDAKKAAKIIQKYSDNEARDILFAMKKKKAAEILAELSPEVANRITRKN